MKQQLNDMNVGDELTFQLQDMKSVHILRIPQGFIYTITRVIRDGVSISTTFVPEEV